MRLKLAALLLALASLFGVLTPAPAGATHFPQGWHWPRTQAATNNPSTTQTVVYVAARAGLAAEAMPAIRWAVGKMDVHSEIYMRVVDYCPVHNCIKVITDSSINGGLTNLGVYGDGHIAGVTVRLHSSIGVGGTDSQDLNIAWHEIACHGLGGGFQATNAVHALCNWENRAHHFANVAEVYHDDAG